MKWNRIYSMLLRHFYIFKQSPDRISEVFFWPLVDVSIWGLTSLYFANISHLSKIITLILSGIILWTLTFRGAQEIPMAILEELWNKNLINIFTSPLSFGEWIVSTVILGIIKMAMSFIFIVILALILYKFNIFVFGFNLIPFVFLLTITAWSVGFFVTGLILRYSTKVQTVAWSLIAIISPFSGIYYSISVLPTWAQIISYAIPTSYIFEGMRQIVITGSVSPDKLLIPFVLNIFYFMLSFWYFLGSFKKTLERGLTKAF